MNVAPRITHIWYNLCVHMKKNSARFELHSAAKMRIEDLFVDSQTETGNTILAHIRSEINDVIKGQKIDQKRNVQGLHFSNTSNLRNRLIQSSRII